MKPQHPTSFDSSIHYALLLVVCGSALPFGSVHIPSWSLFSITLGVLTLAFIISHRKEPIFSQNVPNIRIYFYLFLSLVFWILFQTLPIPFHALYHPIWSDLKNLQLSSSSPGAISLDPVASLRGLAKLSNNAMIFFLSAHLCRSPNFAKRAIAALAAAITIYAAYGLLEQLSGTETILWFKKHAYQHDLTGTFVNKNHFATYCGIGLILTTALFSNEIPQYVSHRGSLNRSEKFLDFLKYVEKRGWRPLVMAIVLAGAITYTHSRAGVLSCAVGLFILFLCQSLTKGKNGVGKLAFLSVTSILLLIFVLGGKILDQRIASTDLSMEERPKVYLLCLRAISDQPILGTGLGTFEEVFRFYRTSDVTQIFDFAHNTYLETAIELGAPGAIIISVFMLLSVGTLIYGIKTRRKDQIFPSTALAVTACVGTHSTLDFSIQIPAVGAAYFLLLGTGYAQSWSSRRADVR